MIYVAAVVDLMMMMIFKINTKAQVAVLAIILTSENTCLFPD